MSELFAVLSSWDVSSGEKMGLLLARLSPCHCSYLPLCMISSVTFSVYAELVLVNKITRVYKTSVPTSQAMSIRKTEWLIVVDIVYYENHPKTHKDTVWAVCRIFNAKAGGTDRPQHFKVNGK